MLKTVACIQKNFQWAKEDSLVFFSKIGTHLNFFKKCMVSLLPSQCWQMLKLVFAEWIIWHF